MAVEAVEASEVAEAPEVNQVGEVSKAWKITTEDFRIIQCLSSIILGLISLYFDVLKRKVFDRIMRDPVEL